ncbi:MAG: acetyltransferase, partial [Thiomicrorhabdus sp.]|nr:acetyltransferase [Thiomicrorhabdus sp.]
MKKILLIGGGGHCKSCIDVIEQQGIYEIAGIIDQPKTVGQTVLGYRVIGSDDDLPPLRNEFDCAFVTVGQIRSADLKIKLYQLLTNLTFTVPSIISPLAYVSKHAQISQGTIVMHHAL